METFERVIECPSCQGTGVYVGMAERDGAAVVCYKCNGTGYYHHKFTYNEFTGRKINKEVKRVYKAGYGYVIAPGMLTFDGMGEIDMEKEGVSYQEFMDGKMPKHIEKLACPMMADQGACHKIKGFVSKCNEVNDGWVGYIPKCKGQAIKHICWGRFNNG